jgi:hypothetical protein
MNSLGTETDGQIIARNVVVRASALELLRSARRPPTWLKLAPIVAMLLVAVGMNGPRTDISSRAVIGTACMLAFTCAAALWHLLRFLAAIADLLLLNEDRML